MKWQQMNLDQKADHIRLMWRLNDTQRTLADRIGVTKNAIAGVMNRRPWLRVQCPMMGNVLVDVSEREKARQRARLKGLRLIKEAKEARERDRLISEALAIAQRQLDELIAAVSSPMPEIYEPKISVSISMLRNGEFVPVPIDAPASQWSEPWVINIPAKPEPVTLDELPSNGCKWPVNDGKPFLFCGCERGSGPYCAEHALQARGKGTEGERRALSVPTRL